MRNVKLSNITKLLSVLRCPECHSKLLKSDENKSLVCQRCDIHYEIKKSDGFVVATIPFLQILHEHPKDYYRFTPDGIRQLFKGFQEIKFEIAAGPTGTLVWFLKEYIALLFPFSNHDWVYASVREIMGWLLYPLIFLDYYLINKIRASKMASYFYYYGKKIGEN